MNWKKLYDEMSHVVAMASQARVHAPEAILIDPVPLARAWLMGMDREWHRENVAGALDADMLPSSRISKGLKPFADGICYIGGAQRKTAIELMPPFLSPASLREAGGAADPMPSFGPLGEQRFAGLHEIGHWLSIQARLSPASIASPGDELRSEALADGFAVAWAAAHGAEPEALVRDVGFLRATGAMREFAPSYLTFAALAPAAEIGRMAAGSASKNPWRLIDEVHGACARHLPPRQFTDELQGLGLDDLTGTAEKNDLRRTIDRYIATQRPWKRADEENWWSRLCLANREDADVIRRVPVATTIAIASHKEFLKPVEEPLNARLILERLMPVAALEGTEKMRALSNAIPSAPSRKTYAAAYAEAARLFNGPLDHVINRGLSILSMHAAQCINEPAEPAPAPKGLSREPASFVLIDARNGQIDRQGLGDIAEHLSDAPVRAIAVVHQNSKRGADIARMIRTSSDHLGAAVYGFDNQTLADKMPSIRASVRQGKTNIIGAMPELAREPLQR